LKQNSRILFQGVFRESVGGIRLGCILLFMQGGAGVVSANPFLLWLNGEKRNLLCKSMLYQEVISNLYILMYIKSFYV
jgi:hypothetical protein